MFIDTLPKKNCLAPEERHVLFGYQMFRYYGAMKFVWVVVVYKHLVPLGPKTTAPKKLPSAPGGEASCLPAGVVANHAGKMPALPADRFFTRTTESRR
jgi:hypothetical protein